MSKLSVSPGPWRVLDLPGGDCFVATDAYQGHPSFGHTKTAELMSDEYYPLKAADATLMVHAKQLYDALEIAVGAINGKHRVSGKPMSTGISLRKSAKSC